MRILQICDSYGPSGGLQRFVYEFSQRLIEQGHETAVGALEIGSSETWGNDVIETIHLAGEEWTTSMKQFNPNLVVWHAGGLSAGVANAVASFYPLVATIHGVLCPSGVRLFRDRNEICTVRSGPTCFLRWYSRQCGTSKSPVSAIEAIARHNRVMEVLKQCKRIYAVSESVKKFLQIEGISSSMIRVFDNTLDSVTVEPYEHTTHRNRVKLLYSGRLVYEKGVQYLIQAVRCLLDRGIDVECRVVGDGWYRQKLEALTIRLDLKNNVKFHGSVPGTEIATWYKWSDVVVVPSIWPDPAPLVVPEARRQEKPVVVTDVGGLPEWVQLMNGVFVSSAADEKDLAAQIEQVINGNAVAGSRVSISERTDILEDLMQLLKPVLTNDGVEHYV